MRRLILRSGAIGDCILSLPALEYLARDVEAEIWISSSVTPLIRCARRVRPLSTTGIELLGLPDVSAPSKLLEELQGFDEIVSWYGSNRTEFRQALEASGAACVFHQSLPPQDFFGHATDFFAAQAGAAVGLTPRIDVVAPTRRNAVVIHPFSGSERKNWQLQSFEELSRGLPCEVEWTAGPEEQLARAHRFENLLELASWIKGARLYIGNDSGITHLAAAIGVRVLALFGPTDTRTWAPRGANVTVLRAGTLEALKADRVLETANRLLGSA